MKSYAEPDGRATVLGAPASVGAAVHQTRGCNRLRSDPGVDATPSLRQALIPRRIYVDSKPAVVGIRVLFLLFILRVSAKRNTGQLAPPQ